MLEPTEDNPPVQEEPAEVTLAARMVAPYFAPSGLATAMALPMIAWDAEARLLAWNRAAEELFGWAAEEVIGKSAYELIPPTGHQQMRHVVEKLFRTGQAVHSVNEKCTKQGSILWCEWQNTPLCNEQGEVVAAISTARDLTRQHRIEREREQMQAIAAAANAPRDLDEILLLFRNAILALGNFDRAGIWLIEDGTLRGTWGTDETGNLRDERAYRHPMETYDLAKFRVLREGHLYFITSQEVYYTPDLAAHTTPEPGDYVGIGLRLRGELIGVIYADNLLSGRPIRTTDVEVLLPFCEQAAVAIANARLLIERERLITRRRRLLETATAMNSGLSLDEILLLMRDAVIETGDFDRAGVFLIENDEIRGTWGTDEQGNRYSAHHLVYPPEHWVSLRQAVVIAEQKYILLPPTLDPTIKSTKHVPKAVIGLLAGGELLGLLFVDNLLSGRPLNEENVRLLLSLTEQAAAAIRNIRLITELRQAQEALIRSEKLRAVGELASGVAHNVNNVLAAVLGYAELIQDTDNVPAEIAAFARTIERAAMDGAEIVRRVQSFARRETESYTAVFNLAQLAREAIDLTRPAWHNQAASRGVKIIVQATLEDNVPVRGVASEIREVLVNLIRNGVDAMPDGGNLEVRCSIEKGQATLTVADTGIGMDEVTRRRVFEPFFTTKGIGLGTGLGMAVAWGIMDRHKGRIEVESEPGAGSLFRVILPLSDEMPAPQVPAAVANTLAGRRILLVEDETFVLEGLARTLTARGATVAMTESAEEALEWLETNAGDCDLVLSDHGMVGMTGLQLLAQVREHYPFLRRVLVSGWGANPPGEANTDSAELILAKPVRAEVLATALLPLQRLSGP